MELKKAVSVCLISLCSAALVVLIARSLDLQTASRLEPQLEQIVEELRALRKSGAPGDAAESQLLDDGLIVYYFHSSFRCADCLAVESQTYETVYTDFAPQLESGEVVWKTLNYEKAPGKSLAEKFEVPAPVVVLVKMKGGQVEDSKHLARAMVLVREKEAFAQYVRDEINKMLEPAAEQPAAAPSGDAPAIPIPRNETPDIPVPP